MYKIIGSDGQQYGPVSADQLRRWITERRVNGQTLVQPEGTAEWKALSGFPEFGGDFKPAPPLQGQPVPPALADKASKKIAAGVCAILLGSLGIHKFILGYTGAGLIMLLVSVLTCFLASPIMHVIGLIEGIIYLCKSDEDFVRTYVDGHRQWF